MNDAFRALMERRHADFVSRFNAADADGIAETFYAPDAVVLPADHPPVVGREAVRAFLRAFFGADDRRCTIALTRIEVSENLASIVGTYTATVRYPDGTLEHATGNLLESWRRDGAGDWWCIADMFAGDAPV
jgi:uncharacterized protein (TIGR02246 family)